MKPVNFPFLFHFPFFLKSQNFFKIFNSSIFIRKNSWGKGRKGKRKIFQEKVFKDKYIKGILLIYLKKMDKETFNFLLSKQGEWAKLYRQQEEERQQIRRLLNRKWKAKSYRSNEWIKNELIKSLKVGELELIDCLADRGFHHLDLFDTTQVK